MKTLKAGLIIAAAIALVVLARDYVRLRAELAQVALEARCAHADLVRREGANHGEGR